MIDLIEFYVYIDLVPEIKSSCILNILFAVEIISCFISFSGDDLQTTLPAATTICDRLYSVIRNNVKQEESVNYLYHAVVRHVFVVCVRASVRSDCILNQWDVVHRLAGCVRLIVCHLDER